MSNAEMSELNSEFMNRLNRFLKHYCPQNLSNAENICHNYDGDEIALFRDLVRKYGPEPKDLPRTTDDHQRDEVLSACLLLPQRTEKLKPRSVQFVDPPPEEFACGVCMNVWRDPVELGPCRHVLCEKCALGRSACPVCHSPIVSRAAPNRLITNMVNGLPVLCNDCNWKGLWEAGQHHLCAH